MATATRCRVPTPQAMLLIAALGLPFGAAGCKKPDEQAARLVGQAEEALARQRWDEAFARAREAAAVGGISESVRDQARLKEEQARAEMQAQSQFARFQGAADGDPDTAVAAYRDLPANSYYRQQGKETYEKLRPQYIQAHLEKAQAALANKRCEDLKAQLQLVLDTDGQNGKAMELSKQSCVAEKKE